MQIAKDFIRLSKMKFSTDTWATVVPDIRALPIREGGVLMWNQRVLHWASRSSIRARSSRYSLSIEFTGKSLLQDAAENEKLIYRGDVSDPSTLPKIDQRSARIASVLRRYQHMYGFSDEWTGFSRAVERHFLSNGELVLP